MVLFGHGHSHSQNVPHLNEDDSDSEDEINDDEMQSIKCIDEQIEHHHDLKQTTKLDEPVVSLVQPLVKPVNSSNEAKIVKKRSNSPIKKTRCHILCKYTFMVFVFINY